MFTKNVLIFKYKNLGVKKNPKKVKKIQIAFEV